MSIREVMQALWDAGQRTMPGGGSEILSDRVKAEISRFKPKDTVDQWTDVHVEAHRVGFQTTATMMYGHVEDDEDIIESLEHIRSGAGPGPRPAGRIHRVHTLVIQARQHRARQESGG